MFYGDTVCVIRALFIADEVTFSFALASNYWGRMSLAAVKSAYCKQDKYWPQWSIFLVHDL